MPPNFFDQFDAPAAPRGSFTIGTPDPNHLLFAQRTQQQISQDQATEADRRRKSKADADKAQADAEKAVREAQAAAGRKTAQEVANLRQEAIDKIALARSLKDRSANGWFTTGFGSGIAGSFAGTPAYDVAQDTETLKNAGALQRIMEMSAANGGKNPLTPLSNADFQALSDSLSNLTPQQSDTQYQRNVGRVEDLYRRMYEGTGGQGLDAAVRRRMEDQGFIPPSINLKPPSAGSGAPPTPGGLPPVTPRPDGIPGAPNFEIATGSTRSEPDPKASALIDAMIRNGSTDAQINDALAATGFGAQIDPRQAAAARAYLAKNPKYRGSFGDATRQVEQSGWNQFAASPTGTAIYSALDAAMGGLTDEMASLAGSGNLSDLNAKKQALFEQNPNAAFAGQTVGTIGAMAGIGAIGRGAGLASRFANPQLLGDLAFGAASGAGQSNDNRLIGAGLGTAGGMAGNAIGAGLAGGAGLIARTRPVLGARNRISGMFGRSPLETPNALSDHERMLLAGIDRAGPDSIRSSLNEAKSLGVPMSLADTNPNLRELAGAAVRRSPSAASFAEDALIPRNRGQIDRFGAAVNRDLGPVANIPQTAADLTTQARTAAAPLYDAAYANPGASSVDLADLMQRPSMTAGLRRAHSIAKEEGRDPTTLGFDLDQQGEVTLTRVPSWQTLDYVKRGLDDTLEQYRDPLSGKLQLNEATRAINNTKNDLLGRIDKVNPDYAAARAAYAGPVQARDAFQRGVDSFSLSPNELAFQASGQSPEHLAQMQIGQRSALMDRANAIRDVSNPFEATLGSPSARGRIDALYPGNPGTANLFRTRDLEQGLQRTTNDILGNSKTAQRLIADDAFATNPLLEGALHAGAAYASGGASIPGTAARMIGTGLRDRMKLGMGQRATQRADALIPQLLDIDPASAIKRLDDLQARQQAYQMFVQATTPRRLGMFGRAAGSQAAVAPLNYY